MRQNLEYFFKKPLLIGFLTIVTILESIWILRSNGFYPIDECAHFLFSRFVLDVLPVTVQTWHRLGLLWLFALPAQLGHTFTMFFSLGLFLVLLVVTYRIAILLEIRHAEWAVIIIGLQPVLFDISYACLAEAPAALLIALSYWCHLKGKHGWCLGIASAVFLFRFEMFGFAALMSIIYLSRREWRVLPLVLVGPLVWIASSAIISGDVMTFFGEWSRFSGLGKYIPGTSLTHYIVNLHTIFGFVQMVFFAAGIAFIARARTFSHFGIVLSIVAMGIIVNTLAGAEAMHWTGSVGDLRYVAVVGPFIGIVSVYGLSEVFERVKPLQARVALSLVLVGALVVNCVVTTHPRHWTEEEDVVITLTGTLRTAYPDLPLLCNNYLAAFVLDVPPWGGPHFSRLDSGTLEKHPECVILWDPSQENPLFHKTELTKDKLLRDTTIVVLQRCVHREAEYLLLYRNVRSAQLREHSVEQTPDSPKTSL